MPISFVNLKKQHQGLSGELKTAFERVLDHHEFTLGREVENFEKHWAQFVGTKYALGCSSGTDALILALRALDIGEGDEVITVAHTFFATIEAVVQVGATPILVDITEDRGLMDVSKLELLITKRTRAIIAVHLYGHPVDMQSVLEICKKHGLFCIEDAAQAHGATYYGKSAGSIGDIGAFSFYPSKNLGALGDAGAVVTNNTELAEKVRSLRDHGKVDKYEHHLWGSNMRMDGFQAAFLSVKLPKLSEWLECRRQAACIYRDRLKNLEGIELLVDDANVEHSYHLFVVRTLKRDWLRKELGKHGIETGVHYPIPCHLQQSWRRKFPLVSLPSTEEFARTCISLPMYNDISPADVEEVVSVLKLIQVSLQTSRS